MLQQRGRVRPAREGAYVCMCAHFCSFLRKMKGSTAEAGGPPPREAERERKREREEEGEKGKERERDPQGHLSKNPPHQVCVCVCM